MHAEPPPQPFDPVAILAERFVAAIRAALPGLEGEVDPAITPSRQAQFGDFQSNAAMALAKRVGQKPRDVAALIVRHAELGDIAEPLTEASIAGPGFINIALRPAALAALLGRLDVPALGVAARAQPGTVVVDLCGVNLAKEMHVGHLRSTIIGDALARVFARLGERVVRQNHVGDWGLQIAMVVWKLDEVSQGGDPPPLDLGEIERLYRAAQRECSAGRAELAIAKKVKHPKPIAEFEAEVVDADRASEAARRWLVRLQQGDARAERLWRFVVDVTKSACLENCSRLKTAIDESSWAGESSYRDELAGVIDDLVTRKVAEESDGALVVRVDDFGIKEPCLIRKSDGGYLYATTDITAVRRRVQALGADRVVYCVDARQGLHFKQVFAAATKAGYATRGGRTASLEHAAFGTILGEDNRPFKTRSGESVKLADMLDEAIERATATVKEKNAELGDADVAPIAEAVAVAAIKYADLSSERIKDYVFSFERMLAFEGNTGPYLLYALVRLHNIFRTAAERSIDAEAAMRGAAFDLVEPQEKQLALALLRYPQTLRAVGDSLEPHRLCTYLYELATAFSGFYTVCPVLKAEGPVLGARLRLCALTRRVLADGLGVLGLPTVERM